MLDIFTASSDWSDLAKVEDPELKELAELLPTIVLRGKALSTVKKYSSAFLRWKSWADQKIEVACFPAKSFQVALYLAFLMQKSETSAPIEEAVNTISWVHQISVTEDPTSSDLAKQVLAGAKCVLAHKTVKKEPITPEILKKLVEKYAGENADLADIRVVTWCLIGFAGFLRYSELAALK